MLAVDADERAVRVGMQPKGHWPLSIDPVSGEAQVHYRDVFGNEWTTTLKLSGHYGRIRDELVIAEGWPDSDGQTQAAAMAEDPKRRYLVGQDAELIGGMVKQLSDEDFEKAMRTTLDFWD